MSNVLQSRIVYRKIGVTRFRRARSRRGVGKAFSSGVRFSGQAARLAEREAHRHGYAARA